MKLGDIITIDTGKKNQHPTISNKFEDNMFVEVTDKSGIWKAFITSMSSTGRITVEIKELIKATD